MPHSVALHVNGGDVTVEVEDASVALLFVLRNELDLEAPRFGCGLGQCGTCTVLIDDEAVRCCAVPLSALSPTQKIVTLEGLHSPDHPHPLQLAFAGEPMLECGYCINGMIMQAAALLAKRRNPSTAEIRDALADMSCRCGSRERIIRVIQRAAREYA